MASPLPEVEVGAAVGVTVTVILRVVSVVQVVVGSAAEAEIDVRAAAEADAVVEERGDRVRVAVLLRKWKGEPDGAKLCVATMAAAVDRELLLNLMEDADVATALATLAADVAPADVTELAALDPAVVGCAPLLAPE